MEVFTRTIELDFGIGLIYGFSVGCSRMITMKVSYLFADDSIVFADRDYEQMANLYLVSSTEG